MPLGKLGDYEILERLGEGGMGVVFKAHDPKLDRVVAIKILSESLSADPRSRARMRREARAEASLSHASIAVCLDLGEAPLEPSDLLEPGSPGPHPDRVQYLAMEFVPGEDLSSLIERTPLKIPQVLEIAVQIASGLEAAHHSGVVHRDLKPSNIRITPSGQVKILDFGLASVNPMSSAASVTREMPSLKTSEGVVLGTALYMAPEQALGHAVDARSDLFSLGVVLYQMVTGRVPFTGSDTMAVLYAVANEEPQPLARFARGVPDELERIVGKLIAKQPALRYQSAHEVLTDLRAIHAADDHGLSPRRWPHVWLRRHGRMVAAVGALLVIGALVVLWRARGLLEPASRNIAVFVFENQSGDSTLNYVASGLAGEIQSDLVERSNLNVASRGETAKLRARGPAAAGHELGVGSILNGTLRREGDGLRLGVELVNAPSGYVRWSSAYNFAMVDALRIKRDIVEQVIARLGAKLDSAEDAHGARDPTQSLSAYDSYLRAVRLLADSDDPTAPDRASELLGRALMLDPEFALAWAERSRALLLIYSRDRHPEALRSAEEAADRALQLAPTLIEARIARAQVYRATGRTDEAVAELRAVIRARPQSDQAYVQLAATYRNAGKLELAEQSYRRAVSLHPNDWHNWNSLGALLMKRGDFAGARTAFEKIVALLPDKNRGYEQLAALEMTRNDFEQAIAQYRRLPAPVNDAVLASNIASAYFYAGRLVEAEEYYSLAARLQPKNAAILGNLGDTYLRMGEAQKARATYRNAVSVLEAELQVDAANVDMRFDRALYLAKAGECDACRDALDRIGSKLRASAASYAYAAAKAYGVCGSRAQALAALKDALRLGTSPDLARSEEEFRSLRADPEFVRLTASAVAAADTTARARRTTKDRP